VNKKQQIAQLIQVNKSLSEQIINHSSIEGLEMLQDKMSETIDQLMFWVDQDNDDRFFYELKNHIQWLLDNYS